MVHNGGGGRRSGEWVRVVGRICANLIRRYVCTVAVTRTSIALTAIVVITRVVEGAETTERATAPAGMRVRSGMVLCGV